MKEKLKNAIAIVMTILIISMEIMGFWFIYLLLAYSFNLPPTWWVAIVTCVLACASTWGIKEWMARQ